MYLCMFYCMYVCLYVPLCMSACMSPCMSVSHCVYVCVYACMSHCVQVDELKTALLEAGRNDLAEELFTKNRDYRAEIDKEIEGWYQLRNVYRASISAYIYIYIYIYIVRTCLDIYTELYQLRYLEHLLRYLYRTSTSLYIYVSSVPA